MEKKHTKGPWELQKTDRGYVIGDPITEYDICTIKCHTSPPASAKCNAELISASPDLLDALTDLVGGCGKEGDLFSGEAMQKAREAIAKAEGRAL